MTIIIAIIVASAAFGITFAELSEIPNAVKGWLMKRRVWVREEVNATADCEGNIITTKSYYPRRIKPFDCHLCLSFWACLLICHFAQSLDPVTSVLAACCSAVFSVWVWNKIKP